MDRALVRRRGDRVSLIDTCNRALSAIGARSTIASLTEASPEAAACSLHFASVRDALLRMADWDFATFTATATLLKAAPGTPENPGGAAIWSNAYPPPPWLFEYVYPADCLRVQRVLPAATAAAAGAVPIFPTSAGGGFRGSAVASMRFCVANDRDGQGNPITVILCNQDQAILQYTAQITVADRFDSLFENAMSAGLAAAICFSITGDKGLRDRLTKDANEMVIQAREADGNEGMTVIDYVPDFIRGREGAMSAFDTGDGLITQPYGPLFGAWG